jgi:hypothetical protein
MTKVYNYEVFDPETERVVVAALKRTRRHIIQVGGMILERTGEEVTDAETYDCGSTQFPASNPSCQTEEKSQRFKSSCILSATSSRE